MAFKKNNDDSSEDLPKNNDDSKKNDDSSGDFPPRKMFKGSWKCSDCGTEITELPFEPDPDRPIHCKECWIKMRNQRDER